jgi:hypothetical protein
MIYYCTNNNGGGKNAEKYYLQQPVKHGYKRNRVNKGAAFLSETPCLEKTLKLFLIAQSFKFYSKCPK